MIEFTHGLWLSEKLSATLLVPSWMLDIFSPFNTSLAESHFCFTTKTSDIPKNAKKYEVTSEDSFFAFKLFKDPMYQPLLPKLSDQTVNEISLFFLQVYASFWCCPHKKILQAAEYIVTQHLDGHFQYGAVHKRQLEGGCSKVLQANSKPSDFSPRQLPMQHPEWSGNLAQHHPLCEMSYSFLSETLALNGRNNSKVFVAFDGRGGIQDYVDSKRAVFSNVLDESHAFQQLSVDRKYVDMLVAIHSDFFLLNPRSTFSWQIYLVRLCLALPSVPILKTNDFYLQSADEMKGRGLWVSWWSAMAALMDS
jgi:hypothetical protein